MNIIISHDGSADDLLGMTLLIEHTNLLGVIITPADSYIEPALRNTRKILKLLNKNIPIFVNDYSLVNTFPQEWREESYDNQREMDRIYPDEVSMYRGFISDSLIDSIFLIYDNITFIETGPMTALGNLIKKNYMIAKNIDKVIWMAGSFDKISKSIPYYYPNKSGKQDWNSLCDPINAKFVINTGLDIVLVSSNATDDISITNEFYNSIPTSTIGDIFRALYKNVVGKDCYRMWDVCTVMYFFYPELFQLEYKNLDIIENGCDEGVFVEGDNNIAVVTNIDMVIYDKILGLIV